MNNSLSHIRTTSPAYETIHYRLRRVRGRAKEQACIGCGDQAWGWAYLYNGDPEFCNDKGRKYSADLENCYAPMCRPCHMQHDMEKDSRISASLTANGLKLAELVREEAISNPEKYKELGRMLAGKLHEQEAIDPEFAERMRKTRLRNMRPGFHLTKEQHIAAATKGVRSANQIRRKCLDCDMVARPASMGTHLKHSGHRGYTTLERSEQ